MEKNKKDLKEEDPRIILAALDICIKCYVDVLSAVPRDWSLDKVAWVTNKLLDSAT